MKNRRFLSLWFPRLGADRLLRRGRALPDAPLAVIGQKGGAQVVTSLSRAAQTLGVRMGQNLRDARAICPGLVSYPADPRADAAMLAALRRWTGQFSPWVAEEPPDALIADLTGCIHLFGGETALIARIEADCVGMELSVRIGLADTLGAAWALARHAGREAGHTRSGDVIDQEARATRARAGRRRGSALTRGQTGGTPSAPAGPEIQSHIAPPDRLRATLDPLPVAALRLLPEDVETLTRLGLRRIGDLAGQPRAALARRFGARLVRRLDQALGLEPEPLSPHQPAPRFALRMSLPDPIGLETDLLAAIDRLLPPLAQRLANAGQGARTVRLEATRCDHRTEEIEIGLARATADPDRIRPLLVLKLGAIDAGPGIDALRLSAPRTEAVKMRQHKGPLDAADIARRRNQQPALEDLIGRLGARLGSASVSRLHPAESHIPEKTANILTAGWSDPAGPWPPPATPRPMLVWQAEAVTPLATETPEAAGTSPPARFRWRRQEHVCVAATGPERIAPEWWLDDPQWRNGVRDYWQITTQSGARLWIYYAHGAAIPGGWFCQGAFD